MMREITIDPITRLEGHGKIHLFLNDDGGLENAYLQIPELRGFEVFARGRPVEEMPRITTRICGVCPEAHHMASVKAADAVYGVTPPSAALKLRELLYDGFYAGDHTTHFYALGGPDLVVGPEAPKAERNILGVVAKAGLELGAEVIKQRARGQRVVQITGGKALHPITALPGGMSKRVTKEEQEELVRIGEEMVEFGKTTIQVFEDIVLKNQAYVDLILSDMYSHRTHSIGLVDANDQVNFYDGVARVVDTEGAEIARYKPDEYLDHLAEAVLPYSYLKYPYLKQIGWKGLVDGQDSGVYRSTPMSRLNVSKGMPTPLAQAEYEKLYQTLTGDASGNRPVHATLAIHWARVVEMVFACEEVLRLAKDEEITSDKIHTPPTNVPSEGVGIVEAPRGILTHHYKTDEKGYITEANLIVGTTNNNAGISMSIKKAAEGLIQKGQDVREGALNMIEMAFRAYDPCFGCATHAAVGRMPMEIEIHRPDGAVVETIRRYC
ncbi:MAG: Ni/Fe hydrogenase subunit alpha [Candidatus Eisenbacteria bacterium]|nr:Ni/Fe hydrogenase subunit alpha [Candidatus Latescibacterota bacterium]MBD3302570.1 Ni/Fe hydrogenase subunit alpha [Candidatus Eisenbacteria bacterium]